jgi:hypothetical protein
VLSQQFVTALRKQREITKRGETPEGIPREEILMDANTA